MVAAPGQDGFLSVCYQGCVQLLFWYSPECWGAYNCFGLRKYTKNLAFFWVKKKYVFPIYIKHKVVWVQMDIVPWKSKAELGAM